MSETTHDTLAGNEERGEPLRFHETTEHHPETGTLLGFWIYLMSDCLIFASLFAEPFARAYDEQIARLKKSRKP